MPPKLLFALMALLLSALLASPLMAQDSGNCAPRDAVVARLAQHYGEARRSVGRDASNAVVEVFASDESGGWTIVVTRPDGMSCLVASGHAFKALSEGVPRKGIEV